MLTKTWDLATYAGVRSYGRGLGLGRGYLRKGSQVGCQPRQVKPPPRGAISDRWERCRRHLVKRCYRVSPFGSGMFSQVRNMQKLYFYQRFNSPHSQFNPPHPQFNPPPSIVHPSPSMVATLPHPRFNTFPTMVQPPLFMVIMW